MTDFSTEPKVTRDKVFAAAEQLLQAGTKPTMVAVKDILGGGSFSTISPLLAEWKDAKRQAVAVIKTPVPETVTKALGLVADQVWSAAQEESEKSVAGEREALHNAAKELAEREAELLDAIRSNELEIEKLKTDCARTDQLLVDQTAHANREHATFTATIEGLRVDKAKLEEHGKNIEAIAAERKEQLTAAATEAATLQGKLETVRSEAADLRHQIQRLEEDGQRLTGTIESLKNEAGDLRAELAAEKSSAAQNAAQLSGLLKSEQDKNVSAGEKVSGLEKMLAQLQQQLDKERERCDGLQSEIVSIAKAKQEKPVAPAITE